MASESECDLVVRGGTVVTAGSSSDFDTGIRDGRISQIGGSPRGRSELDARSALVVRSSRTWPTDSAA